MQYLLLQLIFALDVLVKGGGEFVLVEPNILV